MSEQGRKATEELIRDICREIYKYALARAYDVFLAVVRGATANDMTVDATLDHFERLMVEMAERAKDPSKILREKKYIY